MKLKVTFKRVSYTWENEGWLREITTLLPEDMVTVAITRIETGESFVFGENLTRVSHEEFVELDFDICVTDKIQIRIIGVRDSNNGGDYADDYDDSYNTELEAQENNYVHYDNLFEFYGVDEHVVIYLVDNLYQYSEDYDIDYTAFPFVYANFHNVYKPFTNQVFSYDTTSIGTAYSWDINGVKHTSRNIVSCNPCDISFTKHLYHVEPSEELGCGCGGSPVISKLIGQDINIQEIEKRRYFGNFETIVTSDIENVVCMEASNEAFVFANYALSLVQINGEMRPALSKDVVLVEIVDVTNRVLDSKTFEISNFSSYFPEAFPFKLPVEGDYSVQTTVVSYTDCEKIVRECKYYTSFRAETFVKVYKSPCDLRVKSLSYDTLTAKLYVLKKNWQIVSEHAIDSLKELKLKLEDGVYRVDFQRGANTFSYVHINFCKAQACYEMIVKELMCKNLCDLPSNSKFSIVSTLFNQLLLEVHREYFTADYYTNQLPSDKTYTISEIITRLNTYCYDCAKFSVSDCGCGSS